MKTMKKILQEIIEDLPSEIKEQFKTELDEQKKEFLKHSYDNRNSARLEEEIQKRREKMLKGISDLTIEVYNDAMANCASGLKSTAHQSNILWQGFVFYRSQQNNQYNSLLHFLTKVTTENTQLLAKATIGIAMAECQGEILGGTPTTPHESIVKKIIHLALIQDII